VIRGDRVFICNCFWDPAVAYVKTVPSGGRNNGPTPVISVPFFPALYYLRFGIKFAQLRPLGAWKNSLFSCFGQNKKAHAGSFFLLNVVLPHHCPITPNSLTQPRIWARIFVANWTRVIKTHFSDNLGKGIS
jgi:hypothetical protein